MEEEYDDDSDSTDVNFSFFVQGMKTLWTLVGTEQKKMLFVLALIIFLEMPSIYRNLVIIVHTNLHWIVSFGIVSLWIWEADRG